MEYSERPFQSTDAPFIRAAHLLSHAKGFVSEPPTEETIIESLSVESVRRRIVLNERSEPAGLWMAKAHDGWLVEIGLIISASPRSGAGRFALRSALQWAFDEVGAHRICLEVTANNTAARRLYESAGFMHEGTHRDGFRCGDGTFEDLAHYGLLDFEYSTHGP